MCKCLREEFRPVGDGTGHHSGMDEVEVLTEGPVFFYVIDFEGCVWWDTATLEGIRSAGSERRTYNAG